MPSSSNKPSRGIIAAGFSAILLGLLVALTSALAFRELVRPEIVIENHSLPPYARVLSALVWIAFLLGSLYLALSGAAAIRLRNWARISLLVISGMMLFFGSVGIVVVLFVLFQSTSGNRRLQSAGSCGARPHLRPADCRGLVVAHFLHAPLDRGPIPGSGIHAPSSARDSLQQARLPRRGLRCGVALALVRSQPRDCAAPPVSRAGNPFRTPVPRSARDGAFPPAGLAHHGGEHRTPAAQAVELSSLGRFAALLPDEWAVSLVQSKLHRRVTPHPRTDAASSPADRDAGPCAVRPLFRLGRAACSLGVPHRSFLCARLLLCRFAFFGRPSCVTASRLKRAFTPHPCGTDRHVVIPCIAHPSSCVCVMLFL